MIRHIGRLGALLAVLIPNIGFGTEPAIPYQEYSKRIKATEMVAPLTSNLFGDSVSLYNGSTEFAVTDIDIPGNNSLPVRLGRRFKVQNWRDDSGQLGGFGAWELDVPHIAGVFQGDHKWNIGYGNITNRCTEAFRPSTAGISGMEPWDISGGINVHIPGQGEEEVLWIGGTGNTVPSSGGPYYWTTRSDLRFSCKSSTANGYPGQGFVAIDTNGTKYTFDVGVERAAGQVSKFGDNTYRKKIYLLASRVEDRHGNAVNYEYTNGKLTRIISSETLARQSDVQREITLTYTGDRIRYAMAHGRQWEYVYNESGWYFGTAYPRLSSVIRPDGSAWAYNYSNALSPEYPPWDGQGETSPNCPEGAPAPSSDFVLTATHPSGASGTFVFSLARMYRSGTPASSCVTYQVAGNAAITVYDLVIPDYFDVYALATKTVSGAGIDPMEWSYFYSNPNVTTVHGRTNNAIPCMSCPQSKLVTVTQPDGSRHITEFGTLFGYNDGRILSVAIQNAQGAVLRNTVTEYVAEGASIPFPDQIGMFSVSMDPATLRRRPAKNTTIYQQGVTFQHSVNGFDPLARPINVTKASSLGFSKSELTTYYDDNAKWVMGQIATISQSNKLVVQNTYHGISALLNESYAFGRLTAKRTYASDGALSELRDGRSLSGAPHTALSDWYRGLPRRLDFRDQTYRSASVSNHGDLTSVTDELGYLTTYGYDSLGRLQSITYPTNDAVPWLPKSLSFDFVTTTEYGIAANHWRHTVSHGNYRKQTFLDALWRPVITREWDVSDVAGTQRFKAWKHDHQGKPIFEAAPIGAAATMASFTIGKWTSYDALGRPTLFTASSELGPLTSSIEYLLGFETRATNARGFFTTQQFQAFDSPDDAEPIGIQAPEDQSTIIVRDQWGKPKSITRTGLFDGAPISSSAAFTYDLEEQLCKRIEPESGATVFAYDSAGNLSWSAQGSNLTDPNVCDRNSVPSNERTNRTYDVMNRLETVTFPDGVQNLSYTYWPDGLPKKATAGTVETSFDYNRRRLPTSETRLIDGLRYDLVWRYTSDGLIDRVTYPDGAASDLTPNALGQPRSVGAYATQATYWPNTEVKSVVYGNGITNEFEQNTRQLSSRLKYTRNGSNIVDIQFSYDANGNPTASADLTASGSRTKTLAYDDADRLEGATSAAWGTESFSYDPLDNLRQVTRGTEVRTYDYNASNQLYRVRTPILTLHQLAYDSAGRVETRNGQTLVFDDANRLQAVGTLGGYWYDAAGRRAGRADSTGTTYFFYASDGKLLFQHDASGNQKTRYHYLGTKLVAKVSDTAVSLAAPVVSTPGTSSSGKYTVSWAAVTGASSYTLQRSTNGGSTWSTVGEGAVLSWEAVSQASGTYKYRARACQNLGCSAHSAMATTTVTLTSPTAPTLTVPTPNYTGTYTVSWTTVTAASTYKLEEKVGAGAWVQIQDSTAASSLLAGKLSGTTYSYRVRGANQQYNGTYSATKTVQVTLAPSSAPTLTTPASSNGNYTVSWTTVSSATTYQLEEKVGAGSWAQIQNTAATSRAFTGKAAGTYRYRVCAKNAAGCGPYSSPEGLTSVVQTPVVPTGLAVTQNGWSCQASWNSVSGATYYLLEDTFSMVYNVASPSWSMDSQCASAYRVAACNATACSTYSGWESPTIIGGGAMSMEPGEESLEGSEATGEGQ